MINIRLGNEKDVSEIIKNKVHLTDGIAIDTFRDIRKGLTEYKLAVVVDDIVNKIVGWALLFKDIYEQETLYCFTRVAYRRRGYASKAAKLIMQNPDNIYVYYLNNPNFFKSLGFSEESVEKIR